MSPVFSPLLTWFGKEQKIYVIATRFVSTVPEIIGEEQFYTLVGAMHFMDKMIELGASNFLVEMMLDD